MEPSLATSVGGTRIPREAQSLETAAGKLDEVLLKRISPERIDHRIVLENPIRTLGLHNELTVPLKKRRRDANLRDRYTTKVAKDGLSTRRLH
jgi:hypothetical protein